MIAWFRNRVWPWIWLGARLCVGSGRKMALRTALLGAACAVGVFLVLAAMAVPIVSDAQLARSYARTPVIEEISTPGMRMTVIHDAVGSRPLTRVAVADVAPDSPRPPGVMVLPGPGDIIVSPALEELIAADPAVRYRFPQRVVGAIGREGLVAPDELYAYVGVPADDLSIGTGVVTGYRDAGNEAWKSSLGGNELERMLTAPRVVSASFALFLGLPLSVLLGICVRFDASRRDRRLAALRLVGASQRQAHLSAAVEMAVIATAGVVAGLVLFVLVARITDGWHVGRFYWYASDVAIPPSRIVLLCALVIGLAVLVSAAGSRPALKNPVRVRRSGMNTGPSHWRLVPLAVAPLALLLAPTSLVTPFQRLVLLGVGITASVVALVTVTPTVLSVAGKSAGRIKSLPVWAQLAARRAAHSPAITPKLVTGVLVSVFIAGLGMLVGTTVREDVPVPAVSMSETAEPAVAFAAGVTRQVADNLRLSRAVVAASVLQLEVGVDAKQENNANIVRTSCQEAAALFERVGPCQDGQAYRVVYAAGMERGTNTGLKPGDAVTIQYGPRQGQSMTVPIDTIEVSGTDYGCWCDILITEKLDSGDLVVRLNDEDSFWADVSRMAPAIRFQGNQDMRRGLDADAVMTLIFVGLTITVSLGLVAFVIASIDRSIESRHKDAPLLALGVPARMLRMAEAAQLLLVIVSGLLLGLALLALTVKSWSGVFDMSFDTVSAPLVPLFVSVFVGMVLLILTVAALTTRNRRLSPEDLRRE
ncbi:MAG TPA: FtsX-like permease family protein [Micromonosporaceae bacterium]